MNITILILFLCVSFLLLVWAYFYDRKNSIDPNGLAYVKLVAWLTCFILFGAALIDGVDYKSGQTETVVGNVTVIEHDYTNYTNRSISFFLTLMSGIGFIMVFYDLRGVKQ